MAAAPDITFRDTVTPASIIGAIAYVFSTLGSNFLPVTIGQNSIPVKLRIYNNYAKNAGIATAMNANITVYDGIGVHTSSILPVSESWVRVYESGYGESTTAPGLYSAFPGSDTAVGGAASHGAFYNVYTVEVGSDGTYVSQIRAGADTNSVGFIEVTTYVQVPLDAPMANYNFALTMNYEWTS